MTQAPDALSLSAVARRHRGRKKEGKRNVNRVRSFIATGAQREKEKEKKKGREGMGAPPRCRLFYSFEREAIKGFLDKKKVKRGERGGQRVAHYYFYAYHTQRE